MSYVIHNNIETDEHQLSRVQFLEVNERQMTQMESVPAAAPATETTPMTKWIADTASPAGM